MKNSLYPLWMNFSQRHSFCQHVLSFQVSVYISLPLCLAFPCRDNKSETSSKILPTAATEHSTSCRSTDLHLLILGISVVTAQDVIVDAFQSCLSLWCVKVAAYSVIFLAFPPHKTVKLERSGGMWDALSHQDNSVQFRKYQRRSHCVLYKASQQLSEQPALLCCHITQTWKTDFSEAICLCLLEFSTDDASLRPALTYLN